MEEQLNDIVCELNDLLKLAMSPSLSEQQDKISQKADDLLERFEKQKIILRRKHSELICEIGCYQQMILEFRDKPS